jgi:hypothetical protein
MYRFTESAWAGAPRAPGPSEGPPTLLAGLVLLTVLIVAVGIGNADLVTRVLLPAVAGAR